MPSSQSTESTFEAEVRRGTRFKFGSNWKRFLRVLNDDRIYEAEKSMKEFLGPDSLENNSFLDVGCGSGLSSLVARRMGANVTSFDFDPQSVACTMELRKRYFKDDTNWTILEGSVLDRDYLKSLGSFDIVYSWGVLHHTGAMWDALENVKVNTKVGGRLFIAIYNDAGEITEQWKKKKITYNQLPNFLKLPYAIKVWFPIDFRDFKHQLKKGKPSVYFKQWSEYKKSRGMSRWHDMIDWLGGYPYENATAQEIVDYYEKDGYKLLKLAPNTGYGCHQLVFERLK